MLPSADKAAVFSTEEIFAQTSEFAIDLQAALAPPVLNVEAFLRSIAAGCFSGSNDTFRLGMSDAA